MFTVKCHISSAGGCAKYRAEFIWEDLRHKSLRSVITVVETRFRCKTPQKYDLCFELEPFRYPSRNILSDEILEDIVGIGETLIIKFRKNDKIQILSPLKELEAVEIINLEQCSICIDEFITTDYQENVKASKLVKCGHVFHTVCISEWLQQAKTCPLCRRIV
jgi:hypothetical protein